VGDNNDFYPPNPDDGNTLPGYNWCSGNAAIGGTDEFNPDVLKDPTRSLLISYLAGNTSLFHCPGDHATVIYGNVPKLRVRSYSMNAWMNSSSPSYILSDFQMKVFQQQSDIAHPSQIYALIEESPATINDGSFFEAPYMTNWGDLPGVYHNYGAAVSFADGHCQLKRWTDPALSQGENGASGISSIYMFYTIAPQDPDAKDLHWFWEHSTYPIN